VNLKKLIVLSCVYAAVSMAHASDTTQKPRQSGKQVHHSAHEKPRFPRFTEAEVEKTNPQYTRKITKQKPKKMRFSPKPDRG
jgi:uncharacterized secreted protein with C-terminal beta-propeller domain